MAAGRLFIPSWMPALDSDGAPIPNARIFFYQNETDVLAPVFSDEALTVPLSNPVPANASGRIPAIWASDAITYSYSVDAPYGPSGIPFTGDGLEVSQGVAILVAAAAEAAADAAELAAVAAEDALAEILAAAAAAPETLPLLNKANLDGGNVAAAGEAAQFRSNIGAAGIDEVIPLDAPFVSTIPLPAATEPSVELFVQSTTAGNDGILVHMDATTAASGSYTFHGLYTAGAGVVNGGGIGVAANGVGTANAGVFNRYDDGPGNGILTNRVGSGNGYGATLNFSSTGTGGALYAVKQNSNGLPGGIAGIGPAARVENLSESGYGIQRYTAPNNAETISDIYERANGTGGVNMDVRNLAGGARTTARTGLYIREVPSTASTGTAGVTGVAVELGANFTGSVETIGLSSANNSAGNTTGYGFVATSTGANLINYGGTFTASGATGANIAILANGAMWCNGGSYFVDAVKVVGARNTGWTAATGTGSKAAFAAAAAGTANAAYVQADFQSALNRIAALEARVRSYDDALFTHGLIGA